MLPSMSTQAIHPMDDQESLADAAARRLRGRLAELRISGSEIARRIGMTQGSFSRRTTGAAPLELNDLQAIEEVTGGQISIAYLLGLNDKTPSPGGERVVSGVHPPGLEPGTHWLRDGIWPEPHGEVHYLPAFPDVNPEHGHLDGHAQISHLFADLEHLIS